MIIKTVFYALFVLFSTAILFFLPINEGVYDFRTDIKTDSFFDTTEAGETSANVTLIKDVYEADLSTVSIDSDLNTDLPAVVSYNSTTRLLNLTGLTASSNRTLEVSYDYDALQGWDSVNGLLDKIGWIWLLCVILFSPSAIASLWTKKRLE